jgi:hypothetical protein
MLLARHVAVWTIFCLMTTSCGYDTNKSLMENARNVSPTMMQACLAGGALGLGTSLLFVDDDKLLWAGVLTAAGTAAGCTAGQMLTDRREQYKSQAEFYDDQLKLAKASNNTLLQTQATVDKQIAANRKTIAELQRQRNQQAVDQDQVAKDLKAAEVAHDAAKKELDSLTQERDIQKLALDNYDPSQGEVSATTRADLTKEIDSMSSYLERLKEQIKYLADQRDAIGQFS